MRGIKCRDCEEYRNEWCEKVIDSPYPDMIRDCQYYHEKDPDVIKVIRCKNCIHHHYEKGEIPYCDRIDYGYGWKDKDFCSRAVRWEEGGE